MMRWVVGRSFGGVAGRRSFVRWSRWVGRSVGSSVVGRSFGGVGGSFGEVVGRRLFARWGRWVGLSVGLWVVSPSFGRSVVRWGGGLSVVRLFGGAVGWWVIFVRSVGR